jgi:hypothetical protein
VTEDSDWGLRGFPGPSIGKRPCSSALIGRPGLRTRSFVRGPRRFGRRVLTDASPAGTLGLRSIHLRPGVGSLEVWSGTRSPRRSGGNGSRRSSIGYSATRRPSLRSATRKRSPRRRASTGVPGAERSCFARTPSSSPEQRGRAFYRRSLYDGVLLQGARFDGFSHVEDWVPQRLVTATGPNPLPR